MSNKHEVVQPQHRICMQEWNVAVPTMVLDPPIHIRWFGQAEVLLPKDSQFLFPVLADEEAIEWFGKPDRFRVVFLGQIKDWPRPEAIQLMVEAMKGDPETWIGWLVSSFIGMEHSDGIGPASYAVKIALLADGNCGIITPRPYTNMEVLAEENAKIAALSKSRR